MADIEVTIDVNEVVVDTASFQSEVGIDAPAGPPGPAIHAGAGAREILFANDDEDGSASDPDLFYNENGCLCIRGKAGQRILQAFVLGNDTFGPGFDDHGSLLTYAIFRYDANGIAMGSYLMWSGPVTPPYRAANLLRPFTNSTSVLRLEPGTKVALEVGNTAGDTFGGVDKDGRPYGTMQPICVGITQSSPEDGAVTVYAPVAGTLTTIVGGVGTTPAGTLTVTVACGAQSMSASIAAGQTVFGATTGTVGVARDAAVTITVAGSAGSANLSLTARSA